MKSGRVKRESSDWFQLLSELPRSLALAISWAHSTIRRRPFFSPSFGAPLGVELSSIQSSSNSHCVNLTSFSLVLTRESVLGARSQAARWCRTNLDHYSIRFFLHQQIVQGFWRRHYGPEFVAQRSQLANTPHTLVITQIQCQYFHHGSPFCFGL